MKTISIKSASFLTGSEIAEAVLRYGLALAQTRRVDLVDIPVMSPDGGTRRACFMVGWLVDAATTTAIGAPEQEELKEPATVMDLQGRAASVGVIRARPFTPEDAGAVWPLFDLDFLLD